MVALDKDISEEEILEAVKDLNNGKAPSSDGLGVEIYKRIPLLSKWLLQAWESARSKGLLWKTARSCVIRLIHKKAEKDKITNYRLISLCNADYKIIAKVLSKRIKTVMNYIIDEEQTGSVPGRDIKVNVLIARAFLENIEEYEKGRALLLDFEKAYDRVDREFLE